MPTDNDMKTGRPVIRSDMTPEELVSLIIERGDDGEGIRDRFGDNAALYERCFQGFLEEPHFALLGEAIKNSDIDAAFNAAHALKGLSGNLGVTAFYDVICQLVETLRSGSLEGTDKLYAELCGKKDELLALYTGVQAENTTAVSDTPNRERAKQKDDSQDKNKFVMLSIGMIVLAVVIVAYFFGRMTITYESNVVSESGQHLTEMSNQIKLYIEEQVANDWRIARSVADSIIGGSDLDSDTDALDIMRRRQDVWNVSNLMLYTENGYCVYADGSIEANDIASNMIVKARERGQYMTVIDSKIIYTIPVETDMEYKGSVIAAVSVVQDMETFLDDMNFSSFNGEAWMYLTADNGIVISMLTNDAATTTFNFKAFIDDKHIEPLGEGYVEQDIFTAGRATAFLISDSGWKCYIVSVPIETGDKPLRLFYLAPETVVNRNMNSFSDRLMAFSMVMIAMFAVLAFLTFTYMYRNRKRRFDSDIMKRDRMFDLLIKNTRTAFGLFSVNKQEPEYMPVNAETVMGDKYWTLYRDENGYRLCSNSGNDTETIRRANDMISGWDGEGAFKSGYLSNDAAAKECFFDYQLYPVDGDGETFIGIAQDVTQAFRREEATRNAMEMATRANEVKSRFLSNVSHDIRTPMNAIMNMTHFALESIDQPKKLGVYLHTIHESSEHMLHLINDVLDMSRIESGQTVVTSVPFDIRTEIQRQADMIKPLCAAKKLTLITDFSGLTDEKVCGDALKLSQIMMNLLSNAVKFTPENGAIRFRAKEIPSLRSDIMAVRFTVEDTGMGIPEQAIQTIFEPFFRADDKRISGIEGTGLGLSICKSYVEAMGGVIHCESEVGEGSIFTVELFFTKAEETGRHGEYKEQELGELPFLGMRCLVIEDNRINQTIAKTLLERIGFIVDIAEDGEAGSSRFIDSNPGVYDVIYMDIQMPVMDGYQAAIRIRTSGHA